MGTCLQTTAAKPSGQCRLCGGPLDRPRTGRPPEAHSDCSAVLWALDRLARAVQAAAAKLSDPAAVKMRKRVMGDAAAMLCQATNGALARQREQARRAKGSK
jgi:hypothetical protein